MKNTHLRTDLRSAGIDNKPFANARRLYALPLQASLLASLLALSACSSTPRADAVFGDQVRIAVAQQTMHPDAAMNKDPVVGIDGRAARESLDRYHKSFKEPAPHPSVFTIGVGGG